MLSNRTMILTEAFLNAIIRVASVLVWRTFPVAVVMLRRRSRAILIVFVGRVRVVSMVMVLLAPSIGIAALIRCRYSAQVVWEVAVLLHLIANSKLRILFEDAHHAFMPLHLLLLLSSHTLLSTSSLTLLELLNLTSVIIMVSLL